MVGGYRLYIVDMTWSVGISTPSFSSTTASCTWTCYLPMLHSLHVLSPYPHHRSPPPLPRVLGGVISPCCTHPMSYLHIHTIVLLHHCFVYLDVLCPHAALTLCLISISTPSFSSTTASCTWTCYVPMLHSPYVLSPYPHHRSPPPLPRVLGRVMSPCCTHPMSYLHIHTIVLLHHCLVYLDVLSPHAALTPCLISISTPSFSSTTASCTWTCYFPMLHSPYVLSPYPHHRSPPPLPRVLGRVISPCCTHPMSYLHIHTIVLLHHCLVYLDVLSPHAALTLCLISISTPSFSSTTASCTWTCYFPMLHSPHVLSPYPHHRSPQPLPRVLGRVISPCCTHPMSYLHIHTIVLLHHCLVYLEVLSPHAALTPCLISISTPSFSSTTASCTWTCYLPMLHSPYVLSPYPHHRSPPPLPRVLGRVISPCCTHPMSYLHIHTIVLLHHCLVYLDVLFPHAALTLCLISISTPSFSSTTASCTWTCYFPVLHSPHVLSPYPHHRSPPPLPRVLGGVIFPCCTHPMSYLHIHTIVLLHHCLVYLDVLFPHAALTLCIISISTPSFSSTTASCTWTCYFPMLHSPYVLSPYPHHRSPPPLPRVLGRVISPCCTHPMSYLHIHTIVLLHHCIVYLDVLSPHAALTPCLISISTPSFSSTTASCTWRCYLPMLHPPYVLSPYPLHRSPPPLPRVLGGVISPCCTHPMSYLHIHTIVLPHHCLVYLDVLSPHAALTLCLISISTPSFSSTTASCTWRCYFPMLHSPYVLSPYPHHRSPPPLLRVLGRVNLSQFVSFKSPSLKLQNVDMSSIMTTD